MTKNIFFAGFLAGTLDILAAIFLLANGHAADTLRYIASGFFGKSAFSGSADMVVWGLFFHYVIALGFAAAYFLIYPKLAFLRKNKWVSALCYGLCVWCIMNQLVLPFTQIPKNAGGFNWISALKNIAILTTCIGLPIAWTTERFYARTTNQ